MNGARFFGIISAALGAVVVIFHDFGVAALGSYSYAIGFLAACFVYGLKNMTFCRKSYSTLSGKLYIFWFVMAVAAFAAGNIFLFSSVTNISGVELSALSRLYVPFSTIIGILVLGEYLSPRKLLLGFAITVISMMPVTDVTLVYLAKLGYIMCVLAYLCFSIYYSILSAHFRENAVMINALSALITGVILLANNGFPVMQWELSLPLVAGVIFSYSHELFYKANQHISFTELNIFRALSPALVSFLYFSFGWKEFVLREIIWLVILLFLYLIWFLPPFTQKINTMDVSK